jgi:hypothetical protein
VAFNGDVLRDLAVQFLGLADKQSIKLLPMIGHRLMGSSLMYTGNICHYDWGFALYDPAEHRSVATRFAQDVGVVILAQGSLALWVLGHPEAALSDADHAVKDAREIGHAPTLMYALFHAAATHVLLRNHAVANTLTQEGVALADERDVLWWKALGTVFQGWLLALTGNISDGVQMITSVLPPIGPLD